jgi:uncharacterized protein YcbK (DUF882 family)
MLNHHMTQDMTIVSDVETAADSFADQAAPFMEKAFMEKAFMEKAFMEKAFMEKDCTRRNVLKGVGAVSAAMLLNSLNVTPVLAARQNGVYRISLWNMHTWERYSGVYRVGNRYLPEAFQEINRVLRDFRTGDQFPIDPRVIDITAVVHRASGTQYPYKVLSGYRSPKTNDMLRKASARSGVARQSLHMSGRAIDLKLADVETKKIRDLGIKLRAGGVGFYPSSDFVHLDSGAFRSW